MPLQNHAKSQAVIKSPEPLKLILDSQIRGASLGYLRPERSPRILYKTLNRKMRVIGKQIMVVALLLNTTQVTWNSLTVRMGTMTKLKLPMDQKRSKKTLNILTVEHQWESTLRRRMVVVSKLKMFSATSILQNLIKLNMNKTVKRIQMKKINQTRTEWTPNTDTSIKMLANLLNMLQASQVITS